VRCFDSGDVVHVAGQVDPIADIEVIGTELALADLETVTRALERARKASKGGDKAMLARASLLEQVQAHLDAGQPVRSLALDEDARRELRDLHLITAKPTLYIANVGEGGLTDDPLLDKVRDLARAEGAELVAVSAALEAEIAQLADEDKGEFLREMGLEEPGLDRVIRAAYALLGLQTFFTAGPKEVRAWTTRIGATAPQAAGEIHTDFEKGFIRAETIAYDDYIALGGEHGARDAGKLRLEGKDYIVKEGDVMHFRFNV